MEIEIKNGTLIRKQETGDAKGNIWFIHAFAESGLCFKEAFSSELRRNYNIYVPDLPGFGASPFNPDLKSIKDYTVLLRRIIGEYETKKNQTAVVAHSVSGLIGTWLCELLNNENTVYINVEGNLTGADNFFTGKTLQYDNDAEFFASFSNDIYDRSKGDDRFKRYYSSLQFADPKALMIVGRSACGFSEDNKCGYEFKNLTCRKVYLYGDRDTSPETIQFINDNHLHTKHFKGVGHWHMIENHREFYNYVLYFIENRSVPEPI